MNEQFLRHRQVGNQFFDVGSYERATREYESALALEPEDNYVRLKLARCWVHLEKRDKARQETEMALKTDPDDPDAHYLHSYTTRKWKVALASINAAVTLNPENAYYYERRGYILTRLNRFKEAIESLQTALEKAPDMASNHRQMADTLFDESESTGAFGTRLGLSKEKHERVSYHVQQALQLEPEHARSHSVEARLKDFEAEYEASFEKWQEVLRLNPNDKYSQNQFRKLKGQVQLERWTGKVSKVLYGWMPWPLRLPLTWVLMAAGFWWGLVCKPGAGFGSGNPMIFFLVFTPGLPLTSVLLRDWLRFIPDRFLTARDRRIKKQLTR